ncbi:iron ABC transporter substrate-binding protein [Erythrobacter insulae]|uniref:Iron ABC transporter substrate-binding protein n=1 Tax=Erythrobacter insulae TaxID=2584124 RepID=A0A547PFC3_9SPHN|nr:iron ABC transporter substrate-binding protein [Erythrobacter insulae]
MARIGWGGAAALCAGLVLTSCGAQANIAGDAPVTRQLTFVSLNPCVDAILVEIADPDQILALSHYSQDPASSSLDPGVAARFAYTGGTAEEVLAEKPDMVLASSFIAPSLRNALTGLGLRVETFDSPRSIAESIDQIKRLGTLTGNTAAAERLAVRINAIASKQRPKREITAMLWQSGQIVPGEGTLISELLRRNGFSSHSAKMGLAQADFASLETILANPPEVLLVAGDSAGQTHPLLDGLKRTRVETFDPRLLYCGGPSVIAADARIAAIRKNVL